MTIISTCCNRSVKSWLVAQHVMLCCRSSVIQALASPTMLHALRMPRHASTTRPQGRPNGTTHTYRLVGCVQGVKQRPDLHD